MRGLRIVSVVLCLWAAFAPSRAFADPATDAYHAAVANAYRHYRDAVHYFDNDNRELGALALDEFKAAWAGVIQKYANGPPPPGYERDGAFTHSLLAIRTAVEEAAKFKGDFGQISWNNLLRIKTILAHQRQRSGQRVFSDCVDPMNEAMHRLWAHRRTPPTFGQPKTVIRFKIDVYETTLWYRQCRDEAPAAIRDTEEFRRLFDGALASLAKLEAVDIAHSDALVSILRELHSFDRLIWLRFG